MQPVERMRRLIKSLPVRDRELSNVLLNRRKFEDLWDIVTSAIYKVRKNGEKYPEANIADMNVLKSELSSYMDQLGLNDEDRLEEDELIINDYEEY